MLQGIRQGRWMWGTVKSAFMHHAPDLEMMNSQNWNQTMDLGIVQTAKLTVVYAVAVLNSQCDKCTMWVHNECSYITESLYETAKFKLYLDLPEMRLLFFPRFFLWFDLDLIPWQKKRKLGLLQMVQTKNNFVSGLKFISMNINNIRGKKLELLAFLDFHQPCGHSRNKNCNFRIISGNVPIQYIQKRQESSWRWCNVTCSQGYPTHAHLQHWKTTRSQFGSRCFQTKLLIMWQVGVGHLIALVKTSSRSEISLTISGANIKVTNSPRIML